MRRFNNEDSDDREDVDNFFNEDESILTPEEYKKLAEEDQAIQQAQLNIVYRDLNRKLLARAISMCEKSFLWRFYSLETQLNQVSTVYKTLRKLEEE
jgi:Fe2+ or Zn2+ uptake regulation protein